MLGLTWMGGLIRRWPSRLIGTAAGVALAVALLASIGSFLSASKATMTERAVAEVAVDWQVEAQPGADAAAVVDSVRTTPGVTSALPVGFADTSGFEATTGGTTQTTGPGIVLGLPPQYRDTFPGELRDLSGAHRGVLLAQQTAANLRAAPGDIVSIGRQGLSAAWVTIDGVVDLPQADSLFQAVGVPIGAQPQAPPDNVLLLPGGEWHRVFDPLAAERPDLVHTQAHARTDHDLPSDPAAAFSDVTGKANNLEVQLAGQGLVGDNLAAALDAARGDALYAQVLFLFLGLPGAVLAGLLTAAVAGAAAGRRRQEQALLRARGASAGRLVRLGAAEAGVVGLVGVAAGLVGAWLVGRFAFDTAGFGATTLDSVVWGGAAAVAGMLIAVAAVAVPAWRDARTATV
ncbi:MAG TPA: FtsX-like permease family protein, partial [Acidimicrobiales bacterium]